MNAFDYAIATYGVRILLFIAGFVASGGVIFYWYAMVRSGSSFMLHERIWRRLSGKDGFKDGGMSEVWEKAVEYERFVFSTGIRFRSHQNILDTLKWLDKKKIGLEELIKVKKHFDCRGVGMRKPGLKLREVILVSLFLVCFFFFCWLYIFLYSPAALLKVKESEDWFWITENSARSFFGRELVSIESCPSAYHEEVKRVNFDAICFLLESEEVSNYINESVSSQRVLSAVFFVLFGVLFGFSFRDYDNSRQAAEIYNRSIKKDSACKNDDGNDEDAAGNGEAGGR